VTATDSLLDLFSPTPRAGKDLVWFGDELINIAQHTDYVRLENRRGEDDPFKRELIYQVDSPTAEVLPLPQQQYQRLFRPLLARLATLGADETGTPWDPYSGCFTLVRSSRGGRVLLRVEYQNTTAEQWVRFTRTMTDRHSPVANGTPAATAPQPAA